MSGASDNLQEQTQAFLREFFTRGESLVRELVRENTRLKAQIAGADGVGDDPSADPAVRNVEALLHRLDAVVAECRAIRELAGAMPETTGNYGERMSALEEEHYNLAAVYVASNQFYAATTMDEVVRTMTEVLLNFVGVERFTMYVVDERRQTLFPFHREEGDLSECPEVALADDSPLAKACQRSAWCATDSLHAAPGAIAHIPFGSGERVVGAVRIESFLPQKEGLSESDLTMLELISGRAGVGIENAWIRANTENIPFERESFEELVRA